MRKPNVVAVAVAVVLLGVSLAFVWGAAGCRPSTSTPTSTAVPPTRTPWPTAAPSPTATPVMLTAREAHGMAVERARAEVGGEVELFRLDAGRTHSVGGPLVPNGRAVSWDLKLWVPLEDASVETEIEVTIRHNSIDSLEVGETGYGGTDCWRLLTTTDEWKLDSPEAVRIATEQGGEGLIPVRVELTKITFEETSVPESVEHHPMWRVDLAPLDTGEPGLQVIIDASTGEVILTKETEWF